MYYVCLYNTSFSDLMERDYFQALSTGLTSLPSSEAVYYNRKKAWKVRKAKKDGEGKKKEGEKRLLSMDGRKKTEVRGGEGRRGLERKRAVKLLLSSPSVRA